MVLTQEDIEVSGNYVTANTVFNLGPPFQVCFSQAIVREAEHPSTHA